MMMMMMSSRSPSLRGSLCSLGRSPPVPWRPIYPLGGLPSRVGVPSIIAGDYVTWTTAITCPCIQHAHLTRVIRAQSFLTDYTHRVRLQCCRDYSGADPLKLSVSRFPPAAFYVSLDTTESAIYAEACHKSTVSNWQSRPIHRSDRLYYYTFIYIEIYFTQLERCWTAKLRYWCRC